MEVINTYYSRIKRFFRLLFYMALYPVIKGFPRDSRKILFGAWWGRQMSDNPKYFLKYLLQRKSDYKLYWVGDLNVKENVRKFEGVQFVRKGSLVSLWHVLTAKWAVWAISFEDDISSFPTFGCIKQLSFWHGTAFKGVVYPNRTGQVQEKIGVVRMIRNLCLHFLDYATTQTAYASFSNEKMVEIMQYEAPRSFSPEKSRAYGTPRIDYLICNSNNYSEINRVRLKYSRLLNIPLNKRWYLYLPTWRRGLSVKFSFLKSSFVSQYNELLDIQDALIIEKQHPQVIAKLGITSQNIGNIRVISAADAAREIDTQELLLACNRLITDYSSCCVDFMTTNRPEIYFMYDLDSYMAERGISYRVEDVVAGPIALDEPSLLHYLSLTDDELLTLKGPHCKDLARCEIGQASQRFSEWVGL